MVAPALALHHTVRWQWISRTISLFLAIAFAAVLGQSIFSRAPVYPIVSFPVVLKIPSPVSSLHGQPVQCPAFTNPGSGFTNPQQLYLFNTTQCYMPKYNDIYKETYLTALFINSEGHLDNNELETGRYVGPETNVFGLEITVIFFELLMMMMLYKKVPIDLNEPITQETSLKDVAKDNKLSIYSALTKDLGFNPFRKIMVIVAEVLYTFVAGSVSGIKNELDLIVLSLLVVGWNLCFMSAHTYSVFALRQSSLLDTKAEFIPHFKRQLYYQLSFGFILEGLWAAILIASAMNFDIDLNSNARMFGAWTANMSPSLVALIFAPAVVLLGLHFIFVFGVYSLWYMQDLQSTNPNLNNPQSTIPPGKVDDLKKIRIPEWTLVLFMLDNLDAWKFVAFRIVLFTALEYWAQSSFNLGTNLSCAPPPI